MALDGAARLYVVASNEGEIDGAPPLLPPGEYRLKFEGWSTVMLFGRSPKLVMHFTVCDFGEHFKAGLSRWYNLRRIKGKAGKNGQFIVGWSSDLVRDYARLVGMPHRADRIALSKLKDLLVIGRVETVTKDRSQRPLPDGMHYSVIRELLRAEA